MLLDTQFCFTIWGYNMKKNNKINWIETCTLGVWAGFFLFVIFSKRLPLYISPRFSLLPWVGAFLLIAMIISTKFGRQEVCHSGKMDWSISSWFLMPIVLGLLVPPAGLGAFIANTRQGQMLGSAQANNNISINLALYSNYQNVTIANLAYAGHITSGKVSVEGQIFIPDKPLKSGECILLHYLMTCCAADLRTVSVILAYPEGYRPKSGQWVRVHGIAKREKRGVIIKSDMIESISEPDPPYLY